MNPRKTVSAPPARRARGSSERRHQRRAYERRIDERALALELAQALDAGGEDRADLLEAARLVGAHLAARGRAGRWQDIDVAALLAKLGDADWMRRGRFQFALAGLVGWCGLRGYLHDRHVDALLDEIARLADDPIIRQYAQVGARRYRPTARA